VEVRKSNTTEEEKRDRNAGHEINRLSEGGLNKGRRFQKVEKDWLGPEVKKKGVFGMNTPGEKGDNQRAEGARVFR